MYITNLPLAGVTAATHPLSIAGMTHPDHLCPLQDNDKSYDGLFSRFLLCCPKPVFLRCSEREKLDTSAHDIGHLLAVIKKQHEKRPTYILVDEAMALLSNKLDEFTMVASKHLEDPYSASKWIVLYQ